MRIATWNINSVRLRQDMVKRFLNDHQPDVLCLQETKTPDDLFPTEPFKEMGYGHQHIHGMKGYNGVAIVSRLPLSHVGIKRWAGKDDCRHIHATLPDKTQVHCVYVPAGGDIPDATMNEKFAHKLQLLDEMSAWWKDQSTHLSRQILVGDLNIAPMEHDVWSHKQMRDVVSHTPIEIEKLGQLQQANDWHDAVRYFAPASQKLYSWWSYRAGDWQTSNRGRRLDHIWVSRPLLSSLKSAQILREARGWEPKPSDHVPVIVELS